MNYNITIIDLERVSTSGSLSNVATAIDYNICVTASKDGGTSLVNKTSIISLDSVSSDNFIEFNNLDEYVEFVESQKNMNKNCKVLYLQYTTDTQNNDLIQVKP